MFVDILLSAILITGFLMIAAKRIGAIIKGFISQSLILFLLTLLLAYKSHSVELYVVAGLLFVVKVILIPHFLSRIVKKIKVDENLGLFLNPTVSIFVALFFVYLSYIFTDKIVCVEEGIEHGAFSVSLSVILMGMFIMIFRMKAIAQIVGLLVTENGLFLAAASVSGGMPFFVEIAVFFDIFLCVIILELFVYKINKAFTHIDVHRLNGLKG